MGEFYNRLRLCPVLVDAGSIFADELACSIAAHVTQYFPQVPAFPPGCDPLPEPTSAKFAFIDVMDRWGEEVEDIEGEDDLLAYLEERRRPHFEMWSARKHMCDALKKPAPAPAPAPSPSPSPAPAPAPAPTPQPTTPAPTEPEPETAPKKSSSFLGKAAAFVAAVFVGARFLKRSE